MRTLSSRLLEDYAAFRSLILSSLVRPREGLKMRPEEQAGMWIKVHGADALERYDVALEAMKTAADVDPLVRTLIVDALGGAVCRVRAAV